MTERDETDPVRIRIRRLVELCVRPPGVPSPGWRPASVDDILAAVGAARAEPSAELVAALRGTAAPAPAPAELAVLADALGVPGGYFDADVGQVEAEIELLRSQLCRCGVADLVVCRRRPRGVEWRDALIALRDVACAHAGQG